jgi:hypothetical protein
MGRVGYWPWLRVVLVVVAVAHRRLSPSSSSTTVGRCRPAATGDADMVEAVALHHGVCIRPVPGSLDPDADLPCQQGREEAPTLITDTLDSPAPFRDDRWRVKVGQFEVDDKVPT